MCYGLSGLDWWMHRQNQTPNHSFNLSNVFILHISAMWTLAVSEKVPKKKGYPCNISKLLNLTSWSALFFGDQWPCCCLAVYHVVELKKKDTRFLPGIGFGFGRCLFWFIPRMPFLRNRCSVYYTDTLGCQIFSKCNYFAVFSSTPLERETQAHYV